MLLFVYQKSTGRANIKIVDGLFFETQHMATCHVVLLFCLEKFGHGMMVRRKKEERERMRGHLYAPKSWEKRYCSIRLSGLQEG